MKRKLENMFYNLNRIDQIGLILNTVQNCDGVIQDSLYHPEGDVLNHSLQVFKHALRETNNLDLIMAALLHDVGKQIESHGHEKYSIQLLDGLISEKTKWLILNHMRIWAYIMGEMKKLSKVFELQSHPLFLELIMLARWDKRGRNPNAKLKFDRLKIIDQLKIKQEILKNE